MVYSKFIESPNTNNENPHATHHHCNCNNHKDNNLIDLCDINISPYLIEPDTVQLDNILVYREVIAKIPNVEIKLLKIGKALYNFETQNNIKHVKYGVTDITDLTKIRVSSLNASWQADNMITGIVNGDTLDIKYTPGV